MISERFRDFLTAYCSADEDLDETAAMLRDAPGSELAGWLRRETDAAIRDRSLSAPEAEHLMQRPFADAEAVAGWLAEQRRAWFGAG